MYIGIHKAPRESAFRTHRSGQCKLMLRIPLYSSLGYNQVSSLVCVRAHVHISLLKSGEPCSVTPKT